MRKLDRYDLSYEPSLIFFKKSLEEVNLLSIEAIQMINNQRGSFFTLLPKEADLESLYEFSRAILPEPPKQTGPLGSLPGVYTYSEILSLEKEIVEYLIDLTRKHRFFCVIDDFNSRCNEMHESDLFGKFGKHHGSEVYYLLAPDNLAQEDLLKCLYRSNTFWHSLCILTKAKLDSSGILSKEAIQEICQQATYVIVGAYDGEGYVFWEKSKPASH